MSTKINIEVDETTLRRLVLHYLAEQLGDAGLTEKDITIEVKSKQNYKSDWEIAAFRARVEKHLP